MSIRSGQSITVLFSTASFSTGAAADATGTPAGTLYVNGTSDAAAVTVTNLATGLYKAAVTLPTLAVGDVVDLLIAATVGGVAGKAVVWRDTKDVVIDSAGAADANVTKLLGTAWLTPGTAGTPDVNVKLWNALATVALPLVPTVAGRTLDVSAGGEAGLDWANVGSPTTSLALTGTTIATTQKVDVETIKTMSVTCAAGVTVGAFVGNATAALSVTAAGGVTLADGVAHGGTPGSSTATLGLAHVNVTRSADDAVVFQSSNGNGFVAQAGGSSKHGMLLTGGTGGISHGLVARGGAGSTLIGRGISAEGSGSIGGEGIYATGGTDAAGIEADSGGNAPGFYALGGGAGAGIRAEASGTGPGLTCLGSSNGNGVWVVGRGTGAGLRVDGGPTAGEGAKFTAGTGGVDVRGNITGNITGSLSGSVGSVTGTVGGLTAAGLATLFTVDSTKVYADAVGGSVVREIVANAGSGLDAAGVRAAVGLASANLDTQLAEIEAETDDIAAIKAKTDSLAFTVAGQVNANVRYVNGVQVSGTGASGDEWGPT